MVQVSDHSWYEISVTKWNQYHHQTNQASFFATNLQNTRDMVRVLPTELRISKNIGKQILKKK